MNKPHEVLHFSIGAQHSGRRLDAVVASAAPGLGRRAAARLCAQGWVFVDGARTLKSHRARPGERVEVHLVWTGKAEPAPELALEIALLEPEFVVIDKPAGIPSVALPGRETGTVAGSVLGRFPEVADWADPRECGLVHRLDTQTSGLIMAARSQRAHQTLTAQLTAGTIHKTYLAIAAGSPPETGIVDTPLVPHPANKKRVKPQPQGARRLKTMFRVLERGPGWSLLEVEAAAAYRHQVRAHMASIGFPLLGDTAYGGPPAGLWPRHALHANSIDMTFDGRRFAVRSSLPADLAAVMGNSASDSQIRGRGG